MHLIKKQKERFYLNSTQQKSAYGFESGLLLKIHIIRLDSMKIHTFNLMH
jgi:hypothetical protein